MLKRKYMVIGFLVFCLTASLFIGVTSSSNGSSLPYNPWYDLNDDGRISITDVVLVTLRFGTTGTPFVAKAAIEYDSGWVDITDKCGQYFNITHNLNSTDIIVDIQGKTTIDSGVHQRYLGLTGHTAGWTKTYGGSFYDRAYSVVQTSDGGYAIAGETTSFGAGGNDFWLVKTDWTGEMQWNKTYGGTGHDTAWSLVQTSDGGYALAGRTESFGAGNRDFWLVKTNSAGSMEWNQTYGGTDSDYAYSVVQTSDGGYAIAGSTRSFGTGEYDFWLIKTDATGVIQWNKTYGGLFYEWAYSVVQTSDGGYAIAGETTSFGAGSGNFWLIKTDWTGSMPWESGLAWTDSTADTITLYRGTTDACWNYVRVRIWKIKEP